MAISKAHRRRINYRRKRVRELYAKGLNDSEIGRRLKVSHHVVRKDRVDLELGPSHFKGSKWSAKHHDRWKESTGFDHVRQIQDVVATRECIRAGFPEVKSLTQLDILRALRYGGPGTIAEIQERVKLIRAENMKCRQNKELAHATVNGALCNLRKLGLIETSKVTVPPRKGEFIQPRNAQGHLMKGCSGGTGTNPRVYTLTKNFEELRDDEYRREKERDKKRNSRANKGKASERAKAMSKAKQGQIKKDARGWRYVWGFGDDRTTVEVDVYDDERDSETPFMRWAYGKAAGHRSLSANAHFWQPQAELQAESEHKK